MIQALQIAHPLTEVFRRQRHLQLMAKTRSLLVAKMATRTMARRLGEVGRRRRQWQLMRRTQSLLVAKRYARIEYQSGSRYAMRSSCFLKRETRRRPSRRCLRA